MSNYCYLLNLLLSWVIIVSKKSFKRSHLFASPVSLTKFGLSVSLVWSHDFVISLTKISKTNVASYILNFVLPGSLEQKGNLKWNFFTLISCLPINFTLRNKFHIAKILLGSPCVNFHRDTQQCNLRQFIISTNEKLTLSINITTSKNICLTILIQFLILTNVVFFQTASSWGSSILLDRLYESAHGNGKVLELKI